MGPHRRLRCVRVRFLAHGIVVVTHVHALHMPSRTGFRLRRRQVRCRVYSGQAKWRVRVPQTASIFDRTNGNNTFALTCFSFADIHAHADTRFTTSSTRTHAHTGTIPTFGMMTPYWSYRPPSTIAAVGANPTTALRYSIFHRSNCKVFIAGVESQL